MDVKNYNFIIRGGDYTKEKRVFIINGVEQCLDCVVVNGVTYSPVRIIVEQLKAVVNYDSKSKITSIKNN